MCLLGEHPSGQRKVEPAMVNRDKRELLSPVDNTVDNLPTGGPSGACVVRDRKIRSNQEKTVVKP